MLRKTKKKRRSEGKREYKVYLNVSGPNVAFILCPLYINNIQFQEIPTIHMSVCLFLSVNRVHFFHIALLSSYFFLIFSQ